MAEKKTALWKKILGYFAFTLFALVTMFLITFPYDTLKNRARMEADAAGYILRIGSMGPGFFAVSASKIELAKKTDADAPETFVIDSVSVGPTLFPPGVAVKANVLGGSASASLSGFSMNRVKVTASDLDLSKGNLKAYSGIDMSGTIDAKVDLTLPKNGAELDLSQATGSISLETHNATVNGGTASIPIAAYGPEPTPLDLPKIALGDLTAKLKFDKGAGTVEELKSKSSDIEAQASGTMKLAKRVDYTELNMDIRFKPDSEFQKRLGPLGMAFSMVGADPKDPNWRAGKLTGYLSRPAFR